jgi:hypothetical protein
MTPQEIRLRALRAVMHVRRAKAITSGQIAPAPIVATSDIATQPPNRISALATPRLPVISGVYFLLAGEDVIYVGRSKDCHNRIAQHRCGPIPFDRVTVLPFPEERAARMARAYIQALNPRCNNDHVTQFERAQSGRVDE